MGIECEKVARKAHRYKEDTYVVKNDFLYAVINGAPFLYPKKKDLNFTTQFINDLKKCLNDFDGHSRIANYLYDFSIKEYKKFPQLESKDASYLPGCGLALVILMDDYAELYTLGDCNIVYHTKDDNLFIIQYDDAHNLNEDSLNELKSIAKKKHISNKRALNHMDKKLIENRLKLNSIEQTGLFTVMSDPHFRFTHRRVKITDLDFIYLFSDGFAEAYKTLNMYESYLKMFTRELDINKTQETINDLWASDKKLMKYPRLSYKEDITVLKLKF